MKFYILLSIFLTSATLGQVAQFPYFQNFDGVTPPALPTGWTTTTSRSPSGDFTTAVGTANSPPNAVLTSNPRIAQFLISPIFDFSGRIVDSLIFYERRSATDTTGILMEASIDSGITFPVAISDTLHLFNPATYVRRAFVLPQSLSGRNNVKIRWRVLGDPRGGITATLRFDDILVTVKTQFDADVSTIRFSPQFPVLGDSVFVNAIVRNYGIQPIQNFLVEFYDDINRDSISQSTELFDTVRVSQQILPGDSVTVFSLMRNLPLGDKQIIVQTVLTNDENPSNDRKIASFIIGVLPFSIVVNEIMYAPLTGEPEWIEITNTTNDSINLKLWIISDRNTSVKANITTTNYYLKKDEFAIVTKDSASFFEIHPNIDSKVFTVPSLATFNNDSDAVVIFDQRGNMIDSVNYKSSWGGGSGGKSLERLEPSGESNLKSNWGTSLHPEGSTPGKKNSLTPKELDLSVQRIYFTPSTPVAGDEINIRAVIFNKGKQDVENFSVEIYLDANKDSIYQSSELIASSHFSNPINTNDSIIFLKSIAIPTVGSYTFIARVVFTNDEDTLNNIKLASVFVGHKANTIAINELMYAPISGEPEWFELYNLSADTVDIRNWKISNRNSSSKYLITSSQILLLPKEYLIVTKDTSLLFDKRRDIPSKVIQSLSIPTYLFSNNGDAAVLFDNRNVIIDSVIYLPSWGGSNGRSLERVEAALTPLDSTNWGNSLDSTGATPGKQNYLTPLEFDLQALRIYSGKSLPNEPVNIFVVVRNAGKKSASNFNIKLFHDINGDSIWQDSELISAQNFSGNLSFKDSTIVNFLWQNPGGGFKQLIAIVEYQNEMRLRDNITFGILKIGYPQQSLVINEIMFAPSSGMCEYVELYNRESFPVEMRDWKIHDKPDTAGKANEFNLSASSIIVKPGEYLVLSADSSILNLFSYLSDTSDNIHLHIFKKSSLSLHNDGDDVVLKDLTNLVIDSIRYSPKWHNPEIYDVGGRALERINPNLPGNDRRNWTTNAHPSGGTPGKRNSVFVSTIPTNASLVFSPNPFSPDADGFEDHCIISYNLPSTAAMIRIRIFDSRGRIIRTLVNNEPSGSSGQVIWDGMNDERQKARIGIYVVLLEAFDVNGGNINTIKGAVVVAGRL
ncbi:MAG: lamin tail domain-containing protein [Bacteroidota bacterium]|nr:lamin tail domain-containing protein [Bacteroidota bacterium]